MLKPDTRHIFAQALASARSSAVVCFLLTNYCEAAARMEPAATLPAQLFALPLRGSADLAARHGAATALHAHDAPENARAFALVAELTGVLGIALRRLHDLEHDSGNQRANGECAAEPC
jgi:hypothetical protein